tara:strand:- start:989 stop:1327 length:339 start_codon:yes stop_codon:yes gene_type:complete
MGQCLQLCNNNETEAPSPKVVVSKEGAIIPPTLKRRSFSPKENSSISVNNLSPFNEPNKEVTFHSNTNFDVMNRSKPELGPRRSSFESIFTAMTINNVEQNPIARSFLGSTI